MKQFPWKCLKCRERSVVPVTESYTDNLDHDGRTYAVTVPNLVVLVCNRCGNRVLNDEANTRLTRALRDAAGLLQPEQIRANREFLALTQKQLASRLGIAESTLSRWEKGIQIQQRSLDRLLRLFFAVPAVRNALADETTVASLGITVTLNIIATVKATASGFDASLVGSNVPVVSSSELIAPTMLLACTSAPDVIPEGTSPIEETTSLRPRLLRNRVAEYLGSR